MFLFVSFCLVTCISGAAEERGSAGGTLVSARGRRDPGQDAASPGREEPLRREYYADHGANASARGKGSFPPGFVGTLGVLGAGLLGQAWRRAVRGRRQEEDGGNGAGAPQRLQKSSGPLGGRPPGTRRGQTTGNQGTAPRRTGDSGLAGAGAGGRQRDNPGRERQGGFWYGLQVRRGAGERGRAAVRPEPKGKYNDCVKLTGDQLGRQRHEGPGYFNSFVVLLYMARPPFSSHVRRLWGALHRRSALDPRGRWWRRPLWRETQTTWGTRGGGAVDSAGRGVAPSGFKGLKEAYGRTPRPRGGLHRAAVVGGGLLFIAGTAAVDISMGEEHPGEVRRPDTWQRTGRTQASQGEAGVSVGHLCVLLPGAGQPGHVGFND